MRYEAYVEKATPRCGSYFPNASMRPRTPSLINSLTSTTCGRPRLIVLAIAETSGR
jgi:hypothetical protein